MLNGMLFGEVTGCPAGHQAFSVLVRQLTWAGWQGRGRKPALRLPHGPAIALAAIAGLRLWHALAALRRRPGRHCLLPRAATPCRPPAFCIAALPAAVGQPRRAVTRCPISLLLRLALLLRRWRRRMPPQLPAVAVAATVAAGFKARQAL